MAKPIEQIVSKAKSHFKKGEYSEAEALYATVIMSFPNNTKAKQGLQSLKGISTTYNSAIPPQVTVSTLMGLVNQKMLGPVIDQAENLLTYYPNAIVLWNIIGIASAQLSHFDKAVGSFEKIISLSPTQASAYYNLGNVFKDQAKFNDAIEAFTKALELKPDYEEASNNLTLLIASQQKSAGFRQNKAIQNFYSLRSVSQKNATKEFEIGVDLQNKGKLIDAIKSYKKATKHWPKFPDAYYNLGIAQGQLGDANAAISAYKKAISIKPNFAEAHYNLGNALRSQGKAELAIEAYSEAISIAPNFEDAYHNLCIALIGFSFKKPNEKVENQLEYVLDTKTKVRPSQIARAALSLIRTKPQIKPLLLSKQNFQSERKFSETIDTLSKTKLLTKLLSVCPVADLDFEYVLSSLRSYILHNISKLETSENLLKFQSSLALQCYTNEYVYELTEQEAYAIKDLESIAKNSLATNSQPNPHIVLCLASYKALHEFEWSDQLTNNPSIQDVLRRQLEEPTEEKFIKTKIYSLSKIKDDVSTQVRAQYEENPYPRWVNLGLRHQPEKVSKIVEEIGLKLSNNDILSVASPDILIAGCGTGQHSIGVAAQYENANVLAVDLSLSSLAYAKRKSQEFDVQNVEYMQADILNLQKLNRQFDMIQCSGVLHHMDNPLAGWKVLVDCLKPGGLMKIGLYSELARQPIVYYRNKIEKTGIATTAQNIRSLRAKIKNETDEFSEQIKSWRDFYSLSEIRDLIFHTQEHRFTLPQIKCSLDQLGLGFCGFESNSILERFKLAHPEVNSEFKLDNWSSFEEKNPRTFSGMYQFWCQKLT